MWQFSAAAFFWAALAATGNVWFTLPAVGLLALGVLSTATEPDDEGGEGGTEE